MTVGQNAGNGPAISDRGYALELGRKRLEGPASQLLNDTRVTLLYLGGTTLDNKSEKDILERIENRV